LTPLPNREDGQSRAGVSPASFKRPPPTLGRWSGDFAPEQTRSSDRPRRLYVGGPMVLLPSADPRQRQCERGRDWAPKNSWQEATGFNHRSTDIKSAGAWMNNMVGSGAESLLHRRKVGGGSWVTESRCAPFSDWRSRGLRTGGGCVTNDLPARRSWRGNALEPACRRLPDRLTPYRRSLCQQIPGGRGWSVKKRAKARADGIPRRQCRERCGETG
jgi:hypothetical protein